MMRFRIQRKAFKTLLNVLLSCRCPVSERIEHTLISYYKDTEGESEIDYDTVVTIADLEGGATVFHRLREFCTYSIDDFSSQQVISENDIFRHFCTVFHWHGVEESLSQSYKNLIDIPSWFVSHMLLPVELTSHNGNLQAICTGPGKDLVLKNLFLPHDIQFTDGSTSLLSG